MKQTTLPDVDLEVFEVYRSGTNMVLLCTACDQKRFMVGRFRMPALIDEAAAHTENCAGRPR
jgi:hypothetical protein